MTKVAILYESLANTFETDKAQQYCLTLKDLLKKLFLTNHILQVMRAVKPLVVLCICIGSLGRQVIKLFMLNSTAHEISTDHRNYNAEK